MTNVHIAFEYIDGVAPYETRKGKINHGYEHVIVHMIFDINMDGKFTSKAGLVADIHKTAPPSPIKYLSVVSSESVTIPFILASLNDLYIFACDIDNAYLNAKCREKNWTEAGTKFRNEKVMVMIISKALYGPKSSGTA